MTGKPRTSKRTQPPARTTKAVFRAEPDANRADAIAGLLSAPPAIPAQNGAAPDTVAEAPSAPAAPAAPDVDEKAERAAAAELAAAQRRAQAEAARLEREQRLEAERAAQDEAAAERERVARYAAAEQSELERRGESAPQPRADAAAEAWPDPADLPQQREPVRPRTRALLQEALERAASEAPAGNVPTPLEVAPHLHQKVLAEVARDKKRGVSSTMTTVLLRSIGEAHQSGRLDELVAGHKAGQKRSVPLFGTITVGTAPRGTTVRLQFSPSSRDRAVIDVLAQWHAVPMVVLVRLVLEDRYQRRTARAGAAASRSAENASDSFED
jgi:hypothetical protein